ncbi:MAG: hypothetical protein JOY91_06905 [Sinobacteraceae bacterium]|nr:hypothetical protein [Nevskiaceae bacterium]
MALHQVIQRVLLVGVRLPRQPPFVPAPAPARLQPLIAAVAPEHRRFDQRAIYFGNRYRSGFWAIYLLSALAVLSAVLPLALGWDSRSHALHPYAGGWAVCEVVLIGAVSCIYWQGHRSDWQGQWLSARTTAELAWYLPMLAPLLELQSTPQSTSWYDRAFDPGQHLRTATEISRLCAQLEPLARQQLAGAWTDGQFVADYARWTYGVLEDQRRYHQRVVQRQHALVHRVHLLNIWLFGLTALGATMHLVIHTLWLSLVTTFFPALGASLHGALAQSEAYRLSSASERLTQELATMNDRIEASIGAEGTAEGNEALRSAVEAAIAMILEEHQDWNLLVRPHHLPLA